MKGRESGMPDEDFWQSFFQPECLLAQLGCSGNGDVLEFGCGYGTFTIPAAKAVTGRVIALDIEPAMVEITSRKATAAGLSNVSAHVQDFLKDGSGVPDEQVGYAMLFNILHAEEPHILLDEAQRVLAPNGILAVTHWNFDPSTPRGPSMDIRPRPEQVLAWAEEAGFHAAAPGRIDLPPYHYGYRLHL